MGKHKYGLKAMPKPGDFDAPRFPSPGVTIKNFLKDFREEYKVCRLSGEERCEAVVWYLSPYTQDMVKKSKYWRREDWKKLKRFMKKRLRIFDGDDEESYSESGEDEEESIEEVEEVLRDRVDQRGEEDHSTTWPTAQERDQISIQNHLDTLGDTQDDSYMQKREVLTSIARITMPTTPNTPHSTNSTISEQPLIRLENRDYPYQEDISDVPNPSLREEQLRNAVAIADSVQEEAITTSSDSGLLPQVTNI